MARDVYQTKRPVVETRRINKKIVVPAFSFECGFTQEALEATALATEGCVVSESVDMSGEFTVDMWFKSFSADPAAFRTLFYNFANNDLFHQVKIQLIDRQVYVTVRKAGVEHNLLSDSYIPIGEWAHLTLVYDASNFILYINTVRQVTELNLVAPLQQDPGGEYVWGFCSDNLNADKYTGLIGPIRVWTIPLEDEEIKRIYNKPSFPTEVSLAGYLPFRDIVEDNFGLDTVETVSYAVLPDPKTITTDLIGYAIEEEDVPDIILGASYGVAYTEVSLGYKSSIVFPVTPPIDYNFALIISWVNDEGTAQRRALFDPGVTRRPEFTRYMGEQLPETYRLEIWNIDGYPTVDLESDLEIRISQTTHPVDNTDHDSVEESELTLDNTLAEEYSLEDFPLVFNTEQSFT